MQFGCDFVPSSRELEKVAVYVFKIESENSYIWITIDFFSRYCKMVSLKLKHRGMSDVLVQFIGGKNISEFITKNYREICNKVVKKVFNEKM